MRSPLSQTGLLRTKLSYVSSITPFANSPREIRGVYGVIQQYYLGLMRKSPRVVLTANQFFKCQYYPPEHLLGLFRKSRPSVRVNCEQDQMLFNDPEVSISRKNDFKSCQKNMDMMSYAHKRVEVRRLIREKFHARFTTNNGIDGLYVFLVRCLPRNEEEWVLFDKGVLMAVEKAKTANTEKLVNRDNALVDWNRVRMILDKNGMMKPSWLGDMGKRYGSKSYVKKVEKVVRKNTPKVNHVKSTSVKRATW